jgi:hypothetical protein
MVAACMINWLLFLTIAGEPPSSSAHPSLEPFTASTVRWLASPQPTGESKQLVTNFTNFGGMVLIPEPKKCFVHGYVLIESRFELDRWNTKISSLLDQLKTFIKTAYKESRIDLMSDRFRRYSAKKNSRVSKPQAFTYASAQKWINQMD